ncbi:hypothetical protein VTK26DRAFT_1312 [Humicola hyalothermophila]
MRWVLGRALLLCFLSGGEAALNGLFSCHWLVPVRYKANGAATSRMSPEHTRPRKRGIAGPQRVGQIWWSPEWANGGAPSEHCAQGNRTGKATQLKAQKAKGFRVYNRPEKRFARTLSWSLPSSAHVVADPNRLMVDPPRGPSQGRRYDITPLRPAQGCQLLQLAQ